MSTRIRFRCVLSALILGSAALPAQDPAAPAPAPPPAEAAPPNLCLQCHGEPDLWEDDKKRFHVTEAALATDIHWLKGLRCHDCHGGDPAAEDYATAHGKDAGFRKLPAPAEVPGFCGRCHSDIGYMRRFRPSPRTDQEAEFWTSGHGTKLKRDGDPAVATCVSCHGHHGIRAVEDLASPVYPTRVAETCGHCHSDAERMKGRSWNGKPLTTGQQAQWRKSVHGHAMFERGDLGAPTCNDCHGNHGALPPEVGSVANACGSCHGKVAGLFNGTRMRHQFQEVGLPGCATCHSHHDIGTPDDAMLGMEEGTVCARCHADGRYGAPGAGAEGAKAMREGLEKLKASIADVEGRVDHAERLGMEVRGPRFDLRKANDALTNARSLVHGFAPGPVKAAVDEGLAVAAGVGDNADAALREHSSRRRWLVWSLVPILATAALLFLKTRALPPSS